MRYREVVDPSPELRSPAEAAAARALLAEAPYAHLAMTGPDGPYLVPHNFAFTEAAAEMAETPAGLDGAIYFHTGEGRKTDTLAADARVCLAVTAGEAFIQGGGPCGDAFSYRSLLIWGRARRLEEASARETALRAIVAKYDPEAAGMPFAAGEFERTVLYEIAVEAASFKQRP